MDGSLYPHYLVIQRPSKAGAIDPKTGIFSPSGAYELIYSDEADAQDLDTEGIAYEGGEVKVKSADLIVFLADEDKITDLRVGDTALLLRGSKAHICRVVGVRKIDSAITVNISGDFGGDVKAVLDGSYNYTYNAKKQLIIEDV